MKKNYFYKIGIFRFGIEFKTGMIHSVNIHFGILGKKFRAFRRRNKK